MIKFFRGLRANYTYTAEAKIYSCNLDVKYGGITNSINGGTDTMHKEFRYKKKDSFFIW